MALCVRTRHDSDHQFADQSSEVFEYLTARDIVVARHRLGRLQIETSGENGKSAEHFLFGRR
jgi:hypothetical protein